MSVPVMYDNFWNIGMIVNWNPTKSMWSLWWFLFIRLIRCFCVTPESTNIQYLIASNTEELIINDNNRNNIAIKKNTFFIHFDTFVNSINKGGHRWWNSKRAHYAKKAHLHQPYICTMSKTIVPLKDNGTKRSSAKRKQGDWTQRKMRVIFF